jgi:acyl-CoA thioesterase FadM
MKDINGNRITVSCELYSGDTLCATGEVVTVGVNQGDFLKE